MPLEESSFTQADGNHTGESSSQNPQHAQFSIIDPSNPQLASSSGSGRESTPDLSSPASSVVGNSLSEDDQSVVEKITDLFDRRLRSIAPKDDRWLAEGRSFFLEKVAFFVRNQDAILCCVPAFPCKSSNPQKVSTRSPDGGEYESLVNLLSFCEEVGRVYEPGCELTVVSDGHVFSDCIGVDDEEVNEYSAELVKMSSKISQELEFSSGLVSRIKFKNMHELFEEGALQSISQSDQDFEEQIQHFLETKINPRDEDSRRQMMLAARPEAQQMIASFRDKTDTSLISLYCGFSKFMSEDLERYAEARGMSKKQLKKLCEKIAFEMIKRNHAYSHLVALIYPHFVRFSIHAHPNCGPKFGISLLPVSHFRHLTSFEELEHSDELEVGDKAAELRHLHIPTPWHNTLLEVSGSRYAFLCKRRIVNEELASPDTKWHGDFFPTPRGQRFIAAPKSELAREHSQRKHERVGLQRRISSHSDEAESSQPKKEKGKHRAKDAQSSRQLTPAEVEAQHIQQADLFSDACDRVDASLELAAAAAEGRHLHASAPIVSDSDSDLPETPKWTLAGPDTTQDLELWKRSQSGTEAAMWYATRVEDVMPATRKMLVADLCNRYVATHATSLPEPDDDLARTGLPVFGTAPFIELDWFDDRLQLPQDGLVALQTLFVVKGEFLRGAQSLCLPTTPDMVSTSDLSRVKTPPEQEEPGLPASLSSIGHDGTSPDRLTISTDSCISNPRTLGAMLHPPLYNALLSPTASQPNDPTTNQSGVLPLTPQEFDIGTLTPATYSIRSGSRREVASGTQSTHVYTHGIRAAVQDNLHTGTIRGGYGDPAAERRGTWTCGLKNLSWDEHGEQVVRVAPEVVHRGRNWGVIWSGANGRQNGAGERKDWRDTVKTYRDWVLGEIRKRRANTGEARKVGDGKKKKNKNGGKNEEKQEKEWW